MDNNTNSLGDYFYDLEYKFRYVNNSILWDNIFQNPFPVDMQYINKGTIVLSHYFEIETLFIRVNNGISRETSQIYTLENYNCVGAKERSTAFSTLCNFLIRYNRPYIACFINLPCHKEVKINEEYHPASIWNPNLKPKYPEIRDNMLCIQFLAENRGLYANLCCYTFNEVTYPGKYNHNCLTIGYSPELFCGFLLQY